MKPIRTVALLFCAIIFSGCTAIHNAEESVADAEQTVVQTSSYSISKSQAEQIILAAFNEGWPDKEPAPYGTTGYEITLHFLIDRERIIAEAIPTNGEYAFQITNRGTAPVTGNPARKKLQALIEDNVQSALVQD
jgi:hypothetical protein